MKNFIFISMISMTLSCTSIKMSIDVPANIDDEFSLVRVSRVKGKMLPGASRTLGFEKEFIGNFKDGWKVSSDKYDKTPGGMFSEEAIKRSFLLNFGIGINDVISKSSDRFQFNIGNSKESLLVICHQLYLGKSKSYQIKEMFQYSKGERQFSNFSATMHFENNIGGNPWLLQLGYDRETPDGIVATTLREGMAVEKGLITNVSDTIHIKPLFIKQATSSKGTHAMPFSVIGGYEFSVGETSLGWVDLYASSIGFSNKITSKNKLMIAAASTAILLRNR
jgi:hypothetical protein